ncbi:MAG: sigma 54-interacting transcriptional regulator, partial [Prevotella sp.]|nr:sigma 54-interacting transcriptional regulator [Prevotella sp.]
MAKQGTLLVVDDNRNILTTVSILLEDTFQTVIPISNPNLIPAQLREGKPDVVLLDMNFSSGINSGNEGLYWLKEIKRMNPQTQVVLFTAYADIQLAVKGIKEGAVDFIVKPFENEKLIQTLKEARDKSTRKVMASEPGGMFWGDSDAMRELRLMVEKVAPTDADILITGENGTGKEVLAKEIHRWSSRSKAKMLPIDMGAITETLFESELFGYVKGAFTDAKTDRPGKFELAEGGTLFLDEIGNLCYALQAKLLTVLQRRSIVRVGGS